MEASWRRHTEGRSARGSVAQDSTGARQQRRYSPKRQSFAGTKGFAVMMFQGTSSSRLLGGVLLLLLISGCGGSDRPERVKVSGRVLLDGEPLEAGTISDRARKKACVLWGSRPWWTLPC